MSKFTKTLTATAVAIAVSGPVAASDLNEGGLSGAYTGSKTTVSISPSGCPNAKEKNVDTVVGFQEYMPFAGCWALNGYSFDGEGGLEGGYIERKPGKDLTMSLTSDSLYDRIADEMYYYLDEESKCDFDGMDYDDIEVKKANGKLSKNGDKLKVDIQVDGTYYTTKNDKTKNVKAKVSGKLDYDSTEANPAFDCGVFVVDPQV